MARVATGIYTRSILRTGARVRLSEVLRPDAAVRGLASAGQPGHD
jgi:hypothetical protein